MTHRDAFLADIAENADDDAPRLIFADWLDENGDPARAEFIRVQIDLSRLDPADPRRGALLARERRLLLENETKWRAALPELDGVSWERFSNGFVESAFAETVEVFEGQAGAMFAAAPVRSVRIGELDAATTRVLAASPYLARLSELNVGNNPAMAGGVRYLAESPHLIRLTSLLLHYNDLGAHAACVGGSPCLGQLKELYLSGNGLTDGVVDALGRSPTLANLTELDLRDNQLGDAAARALAYHESRQALSTLWLVNNQIGEGGAWALAGTPHLTRLARLYLNYNPVGDDGAIAFATSTQRGALRELDLRSCGIRDPGGRALAASPNLHEVYQIWLGGNRLRRETVGLLRRRFGDRLRL